MAARGIRLSTLVATVALSMTACVSMPEPIRTAAPGQSAAIATRAPIATASPSTQVAGTTDPWVLRRLGDAAAPEEYDAVAATDAGFVVAGSSGPAAERPVALSSGDGVVWSREDVPSRAMHPVRLSAWGDRLLAIGEGSSNRCAHPGGEFDTLVRSAVGRWTEAPFTQSFCAGSGSGATVAFMDGRPWLALDGVADVPFLADSGDGLEWKDRSGLAGDLFIDSLIADANGLWLFGRAGDGSPVLRHSTDGSTWTTTFLAGAGEIVGAFVIDGHVGALASNGERTVLLRRAEDDTWQATPVDGLPRETLVRLVTADDRVVAIGSRDDGTVDLWATHDGSSWVPVDIPDGLEPGSSLVDVAIRAETAVLVGQVPAPDGTVAVGAIWSAPAALLGG